MGFLVDDRDLCRPACTPSCHPPDRQERMEFIPLKEITVRPADERLRKLGGEGPTFGGREQRRGAHLTAEALVSALRAAHRPLLAPRPLAEARRHPGTWPMLALSRRHRQAGSGDALGNPHFPYPCAGTAKLALDLVEFDVAYERAFVFACG